MTIVANKFIPMSLVDISKALNDLHDEVVALRSLVEGSDASTLAEDISDVQGKLDNLQVAVDQLEQNSDSSLADALHDLSGRVDDLEDITTNFFGA